MARPALSGMRAMDVLDLFAAFPGRAFTMAEIMRATGINVASCHAVLAAMSARGYLIRRDRSYVLGMAPLALGGAAGLTHPIATRAQAAAQALADELGVAVLLSTLAGDELLALTSLPDADGRHAGICGGQRVPLVPPVGVHFLAWAAPERIEAWIARGGDEDAGVIAGWRRALALTHARGFQVTLRSTGTGAWAELMRTMAAGTQPLEYRARASTLIAEHGWTLEQPETIAPDARYDVGLIAAPIFDRNGHAMLSLGFGGFAEPLAGSRIAMLAERLMETCLRLMREARAG